MRIVGIGTQDSLELAESFVESTGTTSLTMLWDQSFETWRYYGVQAQPAALLVRADGEPIQSWLGAFDVDEVLRLALES